MDTNPQDFLLKCGQSVALNQDFIVVVEGEETTVVVATAAQAVGYFDKLNVPTRADFQALPITTQLQLAATLPLFAN